jgi:hypothetical protein
MGGMTQAVECLPSKHEALNSIPSTSQNINNNLIIIKILKIKNGA